MPTIIIISLANIQFPVLSPCISHLEVIKVEKSKCQGHRNYLPRLFSFNINLYYKTTFLNEVQLIFENIEKVICRICNFEFPLLEINQQFPDCNLITLGPSKPLGRKNLS